MSDVNRWSEFSDEEIEELARAMYSSEDPTSELVQELRDELSYRRESAKKLTQSGAQLIFRYLKAQMPWLGTADGDDIDYPSGSDAIDQLESIFRTVEGISKG